MPTWPELPRPQNTTTRGLVCSMRPAIAANSSLRARRRSAAAGISAVSRAMAVCDCGSAIVAGRRVDGGPEIAAVTLQQLLSFAAVQPEPDQNGGLQVAVGLFEMARCVGLGAMDDLDHDRCRAAA